MNVMIIVPSLIGGGAERVASLWANGLNDRGNIHISICCFYNTEKTYPVNSEIEINHLYENKTKYDMSCILDRIIRIRQMVKTKHIDVIIPMVTYVGIAVSLATIFMSVKVVETVRNNPTKSINSKLLRLCQKISIKFADGCIFQNEEQTHFFNKSRRRNDFVLFNPISDSFINTQREYRYNIKKIIAIGRLHPQKNFHLLLSAFAKINKIYPDIELSIYGEGPLKEELEREITFLHLNANIFDRTENVLDKLLSHDLFILSSDYEGMPNVLMEAMATGIPCISTNCPTGPSDLIVSGNNGILIPINNEKAMVAAITEMIENYSMGIKMGINASILMKEYSIEKIAAHLEEYLFSLK